MWRETTHCNDNLIERLRDAQGKEESPHLSLALFWNMLWTCKQKQSLWPLTLLRKPLETKGRAVCIINSIMSVYQHHQILFTFYLKLIQTASFLIPKSTVWSVSYGTFFYCTLSWMVDINNLLLMVNTGILVQCF